MADTLKIEFMAPDQKIGQELGIMILQSIQETLSGPRSGRWYPVPGNKFYERLAGPGVKADNYYVKFVGTKVKSEIKGTAYQASAPGEAPASRTGRLRQSFYVRLEPEDQECRVIIKTNIIYADDLEYGTERMQPRPFLDPAIERALLTIVEKINDFVYKKIKGQEQ